MPTFVSGSFTASGATRSITDRSTTTDYGLIGAVSVYTITAIPEPSTYGLFLRAALLGFAILRRRR